MATFDQFINSIIADGNDGKAFEKFCKHFLETSPEYAHQFEKVWLWDDWPNKWSHDKGIDLVAKYKGRDTYCAIQAKCYAAHNTVPYNEVTNFLADSSRAEIEDRILMMSTNKLNEKTSKEVISGQEKQVTILDRDYFENKVKFDYPSHISELGKSKAKPPATPRKHQITAINDVEKGLQENDRGQLIMACGTGKTFTTLWIKERLKANTVLVLLPSLSLLSQTMREWVWGANERFEALAVCSDPTVGRSKNSDEDISTSEVGKVTWQVDAIQAFLRSSKPKVIFCTYQSSELIQLAQEDETIPQFDLVVCDEAHRCAGKANAGFATVLHEEKIRAKKRLFTTATPRVCGKSFKSASEGRGVEVIGMDDEAKFGPVIHKLTFGQAIEMDMLTDYQVVVVGVDEPMVREWIADGEIVSFGKDKQADARTLAAKIAVLKAIKDYDLKRLISFHNNISRAKEFASDVFDVAQIIDQEHRPTGKIWSRHVDGTMSAGKRRGLINGLKELDGYEIGLLTNARCLSEGVDVPTLDGVTFVDPRGSQVDIIQAVGRAIRKSDSKSIGTIVLPVFLEAGDDPDTVIDESNFKPVWDVLKALRAHDEVLADELDQYRTDIGLGSRRQSDKILKIVTDLPTTIPENFAGFLETKLIESVSDTWNYWYGLLQKYVSENGNTLPPADFKTDLGYKLGRWCIKQRTLKNTMPLERLQKLEAISVWTWDITDHLWQQKYELMRHHKEVLGLKGYPNAEIREWCSRQRSIYSSGRMQSNRKVLLESLPDWFWSQEDVWQRWYRSLVKVVEEVGTSLLTVDYRSSDGEFIGTWIDTQRQNKSSLSDEQIGLLEDLPDWSWHPNLDAWYRGYNLLKEYADSNSTTLIPQNYKTICEFQLGRWLNTQRRQFSKLDDVRRELLENLPDWCIDAREYRWNKTFEMFKRFALELEHPNISRATKGPFPELNLGGWVEIQKERHRAGKLPTSKIEKLEMIDGWKWRT